MWGRVVVFMVLMVLEEAGDGVCRDIEARDMVRRVESAREAGYRGCW